MMRGKVYRQAEVYFYLLQSALGSSFEFVRTNFAAATFVISNRIRAYVGSTF